jgi:hypothetical protein
MQYHTLMMDVVKMRIEIIIKVIIFNTPSRIRLPSLLFSIHMTLLKPSPSWFTISRFLPLYLDKMIFYVCLHAIICSMILRMGEMKNEHKICIEKLKERDNLWQTGAGERINRGNMTNGFITLIIGEPGSSDSLVSGYGLDDQAIEVRSPAEAKWFFL